MTSRAALKKQRGPSEIKGERAGRTAPDWILLGLALAGMALTVYLTASAWRGQLVAGCTVGSACDVVLGSRWSRLFGLPTSFWGFLAYASLAGAAFVRRADVRWKLAWTVALFGVLYSVYLTAVSVIELKATCPYCLLSLGLMVVILGTTAYRRPARLVNFSWMPWLAQTVFAGLVLVLFFHLYQTGQRNPERAPNDPKLYALAEHLTKTGAQFYGAYWCPHCQDQKKIFGAAAAQLPYIECSPQGRSAPQAAICQTMNITGYPTWIINGRRYSGVLTSKQLEQYSGFDASVR